MTAPDPTTITIIGGMIASLTTAIGVLWRTVLSHIRSIEDRLGQCEDDRHALWKTLAEQAGKDVSELKHGNRCIDGCDRTRFIANQN